MVVRLQDELDSLIKIFSHMRESFEAEMMDGMGYKKIGTTQTLLNKAKELALLMTTVVNAKIRFDKAHKTLAESMTPDEELKACGDYIRALDAPVRQQWLRNLRDWMSRRGESHPTT